MTTVIVDAPNPRCAHHAAAAQSVTEARGLRQARLHAAQGRIPDFDAAVFADTGWEPSAVYGSPAPVGLPAPGAV